MILRRIVNYLRMIFMSGESYAKYLGVKIGEGCYISSKYFGSEPYLIEMGNFVRIAPGVKFFTHGGVWSQARKLPLGALEHFGRIKIGNYAYIGNDCLIMPGVTIGNDVIIGAGSVVTKSIPDGLMVAGNPIKVIGRTEDFVKKTIDKNVVCKEVYKLQGKERRSYIENIPMQYLDCKPNIKM